MGLLLVTPPATTPVTVAEARAFLKINSAAEDSTLNIIIAGLTDYFEGAYGILGRAFAPQTWELTLDAFPTTEIEIPLPPLISVDSVKYDDGDGIEQTVDPGDYYVDIVSQVGWVVPITGVSWPSTLSAANALRIRFTAGYATLPPSMKLGLLTAIGLKHENRDMTNDALLQHPLVSDLMKPYRRIWV